MIWLSWFYKVIFYVVVIFLTALAKAILPSTLVETIGSMRAKTTQNAVEILLAWALLVILLELVGAKIVWPPN